METPDTFKNSPIHDKKAILELMDELNPEQMAEVVNYLQSKVIEKTDDLDEWACKKCGTHTDRDSEGVWCEGCQTYTYD